MLFQHLLTIIVGIAWGFVCLHRILCPLFAVLPKFEEIRDLTKLETTHLLYLLVSSPLVWTFVLTCTSLAVFQFLPAVRYSYLFGIVVSLTFILAEFGEEKRNLESKFMSTLKRDLLSPLRDPGAKYPPYSPLQMRMACWGTNGLSVREYGDLSYECAACNCFRQLSKAEICFRGTRRRFVVRCDKCSEPSIIRIAGSFLSQYRVITEARIPRSEEEAAHSRQNVPVNSGASQTQR